MSSRFTRFLNNRFSGSETILRKCADEILNKQTNPVLLSMRLAFMNVFKVPAYSSEEGHVIANAFADKIMTLIQNESNS